MTYSFPGVTLSMVRGSKLSFAMVGQVLEVVCWIAGLRKRETVIPPVPVRVYLEVLSCDWVGKKKTREQVLSASEAGMSKL